MSRFALATPSDHSAYLWVVTLILLTWSTFTWAFRAFARVGFYGIDDCFVTAAQAVALGECGAVIVAINNGLGHASESLDSMQHQVIGKAIMTSQILYTIVLALSKISVLLLLRRIFSSAGDHLMLSNILLAGTAAWGIAVIGAIATECLPGSPEVCTNDIVRWSFIVAFDICIELVLVLSPLFHMWSVHTTRTTKAITVAAFACRLPLLALSLAYLKSYISALRSHNSGLQFTRPIIWQEITLLYSLLSATYPFMQSYMRTFTTAGLGFSTNDYGSKSKSHSQQSQMRCRDKEYDEGTVKLRADTQGCSTTISGADGVQREASVDSRDSEALIIRRHVDWSVETT